MIAIHESTFSLVPFCGSYTCTRRQRYLKTASVKTFINSVSRSIRADPREIIVRSVQHPPKATTVRNTHLYIKTRSIKPTNTPLWSPPLPGATRVFRARCSDFSARRNKQIVISAGRRRRCNNQTSRPDNK